VKYRMNIRTWLNNDKCLPASIRAMVQDTRGCKDGISSNHYNMTTPNVELEIADCSRRIALEFYMDTPASVKRSLRKAWLLSGILLKFVKALEEEQKLLPARLKAQAEFYRKQKAQERREKKEKVRQTPVVDRD
jgi:ubiquitin-protein ligase